MINTILGSKQRMTAAYQEGKRVPLTQVEAGPCVVTHIKTEEKDGYWAIQLGFGTKKTKNTSKALQGHLKKNKINTEQNSPRYLREVRLESEPDLKVGDEVKLNDIFTPGDTVDVTAVSKGKGFAGVVKRWDFRGGPKTHGQSDRLRRPGSIGQGTTPGRVYKGKHMAGRMGGETVTIKNLEIITVDPEKNVLGVSGQIPGGTGNLVFIKRVSENKVVPVSESTAPVEEVKGETNE